MPNESLQVIPPNQLSFEGGDPSRSAASMIALATTRQAEEVKGAIVMAKQFPRDQLAAYQRILRACERPGLAESAIYAYPRGGQQVTGPSIRLAEVLAQNWGNIDFGYVELSQQAGVESTVMAYCWDLETNTRQTKVFTVPHVREKGSGNVILKDPRDIYELIANQSARRVRSCVLAIIPGDVIDDALTKCEETMKNKDKSEGPLAERVKKLAMAFQKQGVTTAMMEMRLGKKSEAWTEFDYSTLKKIFLAIRDGFATKEQHFSYEATQDGKPAPEKGAPNFPAPPAGAGSNEQPAAPRPPRNQPKPPAPAPQPPPPPAAPAPPAPAPEAPAPPDDLELPGAEAAPPPPPAAPPAPADGDTDNPLTAVIHLVKTTSGVDSAEVIRWLKDNRVITKEPAKFSELPKDALALLVEKWPTVTSDIRGD